MKKYVSRYSFLTTILLVAILSIFSHSCANTTQAPTGGDKDTIPPVLMRVSPQAGSVNVPVHGTKITFSFNEFVTVKDSKGIYLSPPQNKAPKYKLKGRSLEVYFEEDLLPNTTYTLDLTNAVADNNESNLFPGFTTYFSTGEKLDSMYITGTVNDCNTLNPIKGATVMLYKDQRDSAIFLERPFASVKTDEWGYFSMRNIKDTIYRAYAIIDANGNNKYDPDEDRIAFCDTLVRPLHVVNDTVKELQKFDMKDTLACLSRHSDIQLSVFKERPSKQLIMNKKRLSDRASYITFLAPDAQIDSLWFKGFPPTEVITEFNIRKDSLLLWVNDRHRMPDTLKLNVKYWKTDTTGVLKQITEVVNLYDENKPKGKTRKPISHADTICGLKLNASPETIEQVGMSIEFDNPPYLAFYDSLHFRSINPKQKQVEEKFTIKRDSLNLRKYIITPEIKLQVGYDYTFKIPERTFMDINGHWNDSTDVKVTLPKDENLSSLTFNVTGVQNKYIVELMNEKKSEVLRSYIIESDAVLAFPYLKKGKYAIRITEDVNKNGIIDTGNLLLHKQPEKVMFFKLKDLDLIDIPERSEIEQSLNLSEYFK